MNRYTITAPCVADGVHTIVRQETHRATIMVLLVMASLTVAAVGWMCIGNEAHLEIGSWDLSIFLRLAIKVMAALIAAAATFGILYRVLVGLTNGYVQRIQALWVARTGGAMTVRIEDKAIKCDTEDGGVLFLCSEVTSVVRGKGLVVYVVCDQQRRIKAFLPVPLSEILFIDAVNQHLRAEVLAKAGNGAGKNLAQ